jgi:hypothetical protein
MRWTRSVCVYGATLECNSTVTVTCCGSALPPVERALTVLLAYMLQQFGCELCLPMSVKHSTIALLEKSTTLLLCATRQTVY